MMISMCVLTAANTVYDHISMCVLTAADTVYDHCRLLYEHLISHGKTDCYIVLQDYYYHLDFG